jgi:hypothetical protein
MMFLRLQAIAVPPQMEGWRKLTRQIKNNSNNKFKFVKNKII